jgi:uncharacterized Zn-finger protein
LGNEDQPESAFHQHQLHSAFLGKSLAHMDPNFPMSGQYTQLAEQRECLPSNVGLFSPAEQSRLFGSVSGTLQQLSCTKCGQRFDHAEHLSEHMNLPCESRPFKCPFCATQFTQKSSLVRHIRFKICQQPRS